MTSQLKETLEFLPEKDQVNAIYHLLSQLSLETRLKVERRIIREIQDSAPDLYPNNQEMIKSCKNLLKHLK